MSIPDNPLHAILRTAIQREIDAYTLYTNAARLVETPHAQEILKDLAAQEVGHRNKLEALLKGNVFRVVSKGQQQKVVDLKITDYLVEVPLSPDSDLQDILIVAGKRESASHNLYASLAKVSADDDTTRLFEYLANEELIHKHRVESLYDEIVYKEN
jgi:rubrerythrin